MTFIILKEHLKILLRQMCALCFITVTTIRIVHCLTVAVSLMIEIPLCLVYRTEYLCDILKNSAKVIHVV